MRSLARLSFAVLTALVMSVCFSATHTALAQTNGTSGIIISEFRLDGPNGTGDEFVEIVNNNSTPKTITSSDAPNFTGFSVWGIVAGAPRKICTIPNGTLLIPGQHYLCARVQPGNVGSYELGNYAAPDFNTFTLQPAASLAVDGGIALFSSEDVQINTDGTFFSTLGTVFREDAVGFKKKNSDTFPLSFAPAFREGDGLNPIGDQTPAGRSSQAGAPGGSAVREYSFVRKHQIAANGGWSGPVYNDANNNSVDFALVSNIGDFNSFPAEMDSAAVQPAFAGFNFDPSPNGFPGTEAATTPVFGAPGPQSLASPAERNFNTQFLRSAFDTGSAVDVSPNRERNSQIVCGSSRGDLILRFTYKNNTGLAQSNLRVRWVDISTLTRNNPNFTSIIDLLDSTQATRRLFVNNGRDINTGTSAAALAAQNDPPLAPGDGSGGNPANDGIVNARPAGGAGEKTVRGTFVEGVNKNPTVTYNGGSFPPFGFVVQNFRQVNPTETDLNANPGSPCRVGGLNSATVAAPPTAAPSPTTTTTALPATLPVGGSISLEHRFGVIKQGQFLIVGIIESN
jgi:hypothetical protein